eukprot:TRINITY_DN6771_c0_g1_i1.p1 TRINITY_DN6771_c0_g1~~TRINITY_DN6771_c0_g1_i1.p1  ORF type:complete len:141 (+),score=45.67 TRINITY_DN6771_c0_g1_i1:59-424(+)
MCIRDRYMGIHMNTKIFLLLVIVTIFGLITAQKSAAVNFNEVRRIAMELKAIAEQKVRVAALARQQAQEKARIARHEAEERARKLKEETEAKLRPLKERFGGKTVQLLNPGKLIRDLISSN